MAFFAQHRRATLGFPSRWKHGLCAVALGLMLCRSPARALDLDGNDGLNTETIAGRQELRDWDNAKKYGAEPVGTRDRRALKPDGLRTDDYLIFPTVGALVIFDDNILAHDIEKVADIRTELAPSVKLQSQFARHGLDFSLDGKIVNYLEHSEQDYANVRAKVDGVLHFDNANTLALAALTSFEHEERDDPSYPLNARGPVPVFHNRAAVGITHDVGRLYGTISAAAESWSYSDVEAVNGSLLDETGRDAATFSNQVKAAYRISPGFELVGKLRGSRTENRGDARIDRDAWGFEALAGLAFEANPLLRWRILGGYGVRDFDQANLANISTTLLEADVQWLPTQRLSIYAIVAREILETADLTSTGVVQSSLKVRAEFELFHDLVLTAQAQIRVDEYSGLNRSDQIWDAGVGLDYYLTKNWLFTFGVEHQVRDSTSDSLDMHRNKVMIGAKLRF